MFYDEMHHTQRSLTFRMKILRETNPNPNPNPNPNLTLITLDGETDREMDWEKKTE